MELVVLIPRAFEGKETHFAAAGLGHIEDLDTLSFCGEQYLMMVHLRVEETIVVDRTGVLPYSGSVKGIA